jgi:hypothetical protein
MSLRFFFTAFLFTSLAVVGQTVSNGTSSPTSIPPGPGLQGNSGYVIGPTGNGQVPASTVTFASPAPTTGISEAGIAGISDHTPLPQGVQSTLGASTVVYSSASPTVFYANQSATGVVGGPESASETPVSDLAPSVYAGTNTSAPASTANASLSLGEVATQNKSRNGAQRAHSYTNADVQKLISRRGTGNIMEAANRVPSGVMAPEQNPQAAASGTVPPQNTNSSTASNAAQSTSQSASGSSAQGTPTAQAPAPAGGNSGNQSTASAQQNAGTTPQIRQTQPGEAQENGQQLPATSTILPLLGLIGLASGGLGLWFRRSRK